MPERSTHLRRKVIVLSGLMLVVAGLRPGAHAELRAIDWLDEPSIVDAYFQKDTGAPKDPRFFVNARLKDILTIPMGEIRELSSADRKGPFYLELLEIESVSGLHRLLHFGAERLEDLEYVPGKEYCLQYEPLERRTISLGQLLGFKKPVGRTTASKPLERLDSLRLADLDGLLVLVPGTMNVCYKARVFTISVLSSEGHCRELADGSATVYECEHRIDGALRSSAVMRMDPAQDPTANCERTTGAGVCVSFGSSKWGIPSPP